MKASSDLLREERERRGMTSTSAARAVGVALPTYRKWEAGHSNPRTNRIRIKIHQEFGVLWPLLDCANPKCDNVLGLDVISAIHQKSYCGQCECAFDGCAGKPAARGFCRRCYSRLRQTGTVEYTRTGKPYESNKGKVCRNPECNESAWSRGCCGPCYSAEQRNIEKWGDAGIGDFTRTRHPRYSQPHPDGDKKSCSRCHRMLPLDAFKKHRGGVLGRAAKCGRCAAERRRELSYGDHISLDRLMEWQRGLCPCGKPLAPNGDWSNIAVDHDRGCCDWNGSPGRPTCGRCTRGLLHIGCNANLGQMGDDIPSITRWLAYLLEHEARRANATTTLKESARRAA